MAEAERALIAAKDGDLQTLRSLRRSVPVAADDFGATALHYAARTGQIECVKWLVQAIGISSSVRGASGATPLHDSAAQGQLECVKYFLANGADVEMRDRSGHTALHLAARFGRFETVKWLIEKGNSNARAKSRNHMTPVHFSASGGHLTCLQLLIFKAGYSSVNDPATDGTTPLYLATQDGNLDCLKYLHSVGGKCNARAKDGMLPIHAAAQNGHLDCVGYLIESGQADVSERDTTGATPAHYAATQGHVNVLKWLNVKGDISLTDKLGGSPLHDAAEQGQFECLRYLVETLDMDVNETDREGLTPLALAKRTGHRKCVDYLKIALSRQAKAQKRQGQFSSSSLSSLTGSNVKIQGRELVSDNLATKTSSETAMEGAPGQHTVNKGIARKESNSEEAGRDQANLESQKNSSKHSHSVANGNRNGNSSSGEKEGKFGTESKRDFPSEITAAKENSIAQNKQSEHHSVANDITNNSKNNIEGGHKKENTTDNSSSFTAPDCSHGNDTPLHASPPSDRVKPLRERQLQPLPHFGEIVPPPVEFSESSAYSDGKSKKSEALYQDNMTLNEKNHLSGLFETRGIHHRVRFEEDSCKVIVEVQSLESDGNVWKTKDKLNDQTKTIEFGTQDSDVMQKRVRGDVNHLVSKGVCPSDAKESPSEEFGSNFPPWKKQMLMNRRQKEKAQERREREKREIEDRMWISVPSWKIPLLAKREEERLKEEQHWMGVPQWKKNLLSRRGTREIYSKYHDSGKFIKRTRLGSDNCEQPGRMPSLEETN